MTRHSGLARPLSHPMLLKDRTVLVTLEDARTLIMERFSEVRQWRLLERTIETLMAAARSGDDQPDLVEDATAMIERVLQARHLL